MTSIPVKATLKATVETPLSLSDDPSAVKVEEIPLPPPELWAELDNSKAAGSAPAPEAKPASKAAPREVAAIVFDEPVFKTIRLDFPFRFADLGHVAEITVRRLSVAQVGDILTDRPPNMPDMFDIYAAMTSIPAPVLRALEAGDGDKVTGTCWDFLPRLLRPAPTSPNGSSST